MRITRKKLIGCCITFCLLCIFQAYVIEMKIPGGGVLTAFLQAIVAFATLWNLLGNQETSRRNNERLDDVENRLDTIGRNVGTITHAVARTPLLSVVALGSASEDVIELEVPRIDPNAAAEAAQARRAPRRRGGPLIDSIDQMLDRGNPNYDIEKAYYDEAIRGVLTLPIAVRNSGEIGATDVEVFLYIPAELRPATSLPEKPSPTRMPYIDPEILSKDGPDLARTGGDGFQAHWTTPGLNPDIRMRLRRLYLTPRYATMDYKLKYSITCKTGARSNGELVLKIRAV